MEKRIAEIVLLSKKNDYQNYKQLVEEFITLDGHVFVKDIDILEELSENLLAANDTDGLNYTAILFVLNWLNQGIQSSSNDLHSFFVKLKNHYYSDYKRSLIQLFEILCNPKFISSLRLETIKSLYWCYFDSLHKKSASVFRYALKEVYMEAKGDKKDLVLDVIIDSLEILDDLCFYTPPDFLKDIYNSTRLELHKLKVLEAISQLPKIFESDSKFELEYDLAYLLRDLFVKELCSDNKLLASKTARTICLWIEHYYLSNHEDEGCFEDLLEMVKDESSIDLLSLLKKIDTLTLTTIYRFKNLVDKLAQD